MWIHFGENFIDIWGGADFGPYSSQSFQNFEIFLIYLQWIYKYRNNNLVIHISWNTSDKSTCLVHISFILIMWKYCLEILDYMCYHSIVFFTQQGSHKIYMQFYKYILKVKKWFFYFYIFLKLKLKWQSIEENKTEKKIKQKYHTVRTFPKSDLNIVEICLEISYVIMVNRRKTEQPRHNICWYNFSFSLTINAEGNDGHYIINLNNLRGTFHTNYL